MRYSASCSRNALICASLLIGRAFDSAANSRTGVRSASISRKDDKAAQPAPLAANVLGHLLPALLSSSRPHRPPSTVSASALSAPSRSAGGWPPTRF